MKGDHITRWWLTRISIHFFDKDDYILHDEDNRIHIYKAYTLHELSFLSPLCLKSFYWISKEIYMAILEYAIKQRI